MTDIIPIEFALPHIVSEVICVKCGSRWISCRPESVLLKDIVCEKCGSGYVIETGQELEDTQDE